MRRYRTSCRQLSLLRVSQSTRKINLCKKRFAMMPTICCRIWLCAKLVARWQTTLQMCAWSLRSFYPLSQKSLRRSCPRTAIVIATIGKPSTSMCILSSSRSFSSRCLTYNNWITLILALTQCRQAALQEIVNVGGAATRSSCCLCDQTKIKRVVVIYVTEIALTK